MGVFFGLCVLLDDPMCLMEKISSDLASLVRPIAFAIPDPNNAKLHPEVSIAALKASLATHGQVKPVVYWVDEDGQAIIKAGNGTFLAAQELGWKKIAMTRFEGTDREAMAYALLDNKLGELAPWNPDVLNAQVQELERTHWDAEDVPGIAWDVPATSWEAPDAPVAAAPQVIDVIAVPTPKAPATPAPRAGSPSRVSSVSRVSPGDLWVFHQTYDGQEHEHRLACATPTTHEIRKLCGSVVPALRRVCVPPDETDRFWFPVGTDATNLPGIWPGYQPLVLALSEELKKADWDYTDIARITKMPVAKAVDWFAWADFWKFLSKDAYDALTLAGQEKGVFYHPYEDLESFYQGLREDEGRDAGYLEPFFLSVGEGGVFLDGNPGSGSFVGAVSTGRICYGILADPEKCARILEEVETRTKIKGEKL